MAETNPRGSDVYNKVNIESKNLFHFYCLNGLLNNEPTAYSFIEIHCIGST